MKKSKQKALERKGWKIGDTQEFLNLSNGVFKGDACRCSVIR